MWFEAIRAWSLKLWLKFCERLTKGGHTVFWTGLSGDWGLCFRLPFFCFIEHWRPLDFSFILYPPWCFHVSHTRMTLPTFENNHNMQQHRRSSAHSVPAPNSYPTERQRQNQKPTHSCLHRRVHVLCRLCLFQTVSLSELLPSLSALVPCRKSRCHSRVWLQWWSQCRRRWRRGWSDDSVQLRTCPNRKPGTLHITYQILIEAGYKNPYPALIKTFIEPLDKDNGREHKSPPSPGTCGQATHPPPTRVQD